MVTATREIDFECKACGARRRGVVTGSASSRRFAQGARAAAEQDRAGAERNIDHTVAALRCPACGVLPAGAVLRWWWGNFWFLFFLLLVFTLAAAAPTLLETKDGEFISASAGAMYGLVLLPVVILAVRAWLEVKRNVKWQ